VRERSTKLRSIAFNVLLRLSWVAAGSSHTDYTMGLREELEVQGNWLFRWRSYLPLLIIPVLIIALQSSGTPERVIGDVGERLYEEFCIALSFAGLAIRFITVGHVPDGTSGKNRKKQRAEMLNTTGMYSIVRHPLYLGNFIISLGIAFFTEVWWFVLITALVFWLYYERIMFAEEEFLRSKFGALYLEWTEKTPAFLPNFRRWQRPNLSFSFRYALKREYSAPFGVITSFVLMDIARSLFAGDGFELKLIWVISFSFGVGLFITVRILRKRTAMLDIKRRYRERSRIA